MVRVSTLRRIRRFPRWKLRLLPESIFWLLVARLSLVFVPFPRIGRYLGTLQPPAPPEPITDEATALTVFRVGRTIDTAADHSPLELVCLPRALAGWQMLHRRGIASRLHFGAVREPERPGLNTHAWAHASACLKQAAVYGSLWKSRAPWRNFAACLRANTKPMPPSSIRM